MIGLPCIISYLVNWQKQCFRKGLEARQTLGAPPSGGALRNANKMNIMRRENFLTKKIVKTLPTSTNCSQTIIMKLF